ncbi:hypothetical protein IW136_001623 [Coemansia sp. RSA 678]|nr:hypothetical protein IW136_001623 [Coemansia sp. RSA 678]
MVRRIGTRKPRGIVLQLYVDSTYRPHVKRMMWVVAKRLAYPLNGTFWQGMSTYTRRNCYLEQNRRPMNRASGSEDDVYVSEEEPADDVHMNRSGGENTHPDQAESSEATVLNISADLFDMSIGELDEAPAISAPASSDAATHDLNASDAAMSNAATHDLNASDAAMSDGATQDPNASDAATSDAATHDSNVSDAAMSDSATHNPNASDAAMSDAAMSDAAMSDATTHNPNASDAATHNLNVSDVAMSDAAMNDAAMSTPTASTRTASAPAASTLTASTPTASTPIASVPAASAPTASAPTASTPTASTLTASDAANRDMPIVTRTMALAPKRPRPGSKCVDEPATKKVAINPLADSTDIGDQELDVILADYPDKRPAMMSRMTKLAVALYAETPDVDCITKLLNALHQTGVPAHDHMLVQTCAPRVVPARRVTLKDISKAVGNGIAVMNLVQAFEYVLWVAKWEVALRRNYPRNSYLFMEMVPVADIANGQRDGQTIYKLTGPLMQQANYATKYDKAANEMMGEELGRGARNWFNCQLATAKVFVYIALMGRGKFDRICCQTLNKSTLRDLLPIVLQDYKLFQFVVKKANVNYNCTQLGIKDAQTWGAVCDLACHTGSTMFVDIVKQDKAVEDMMDRFVKNLL